MLIIHINPKKDIVIEALESVLCDVIKIRLKRRDERGSGKEGDG